MKIMMTMRQRTRWLALAPLAAAALVGCSGGGGGSGSGTSAASTLNGVAVDGYLQGATVFLDRNGNGVRDSGEPSTVTDGSGRYSLDLTGISATALTGLKVIVSGGIDTDTGYAFAGHLSARIEQAVSGQVVTPLTTLVDAMVEQGLAADASSARSQIATALGLSASDLSLDPMLYLDSKPGLYSSQVALQRAIQLLASANAAASPQQAQQQVIQALAAAVKAQSSRVSPGTLIAQLPATLQQTAAAARLADSLHDALETALSDTDRNRGRDRSRAVLKSLDQLRVKAEHSGDYDLGRQAGELDRESGLGTSQPVSQLVDDDDSNDSQAVTLLGNNQPAAGSTYSQPANTAGRLLASNCFQCHGTGGLGGFDNIRGSEAAEVREYLGKSASSDIMAAHAQGYTSAQLDAIIAYLQQR